MVVKWLGKEVDLEDLSISNLPAMMVRVLAYLVKTFQAVVWSKLTSVNKQKHMHPEKDKKRRYASLGRIDIQIIKDN